MRQQIRDEITIMSLEERIELFMELYRAGALDRKEMRSIAGLDEKAYEEQMAEVRGEIMDEYFEELPTDVLADEYNRMLKEDKGL